MLYPRRCVSRRGYHLFFFITQNDWRVASKRGGGGGGDNAFNSEQHLTDTLHSSELQQLTSFLTSSINPGSTPVDADEIPFFSPCKREDNVETDRHNISTCKWKYNGVHRQKTANNYLNLTPHPHPHFTSEIARKLKTNYAKFISISNTYIYKVHFTLNLSLFQQRRRRQT